MCDQQPLIAVYFGGENIRNPTPTPTIKSAHTRGTLRLAGLDEAHFQL